MELCKINKLLLIFLPGGDIRGFVDKCQLFAEISKHHCFTGQMVIFPVILEANVVNTYSIAFKQLFGNYNQLFDLLKSNVQNIDGVQEDLVSCTSAIDESLEHMLKEEEQFFSSLENVRDKGFFSLAICLCYPCLCTVLSSIMPFTFDTLLYDEMFVPYCPTTWCTCNF